VWDVDTCELLSAFHAGSMKVVSLLATFSEGLLMSVTEDGKIKVSSRQTWRLYEY